MKLETALGAKNTEEEFGILPNGKKMVHRKML